MIKVFGSPKYSLKFSMDNIEPSLPLCVCVCVCVYVHT